MGELEYFQVGRHLPGTHVLAQVCDGCCHSHKVEPKRPADSGSQSLMCAVCGHYGIGSAMECVVNDWGHIDPRRTAMTSTVDKMMAEIESRVVLNKPAMAVIRGALVDAMTTPTESAGGKVAWLRKNGFRFNGDIEPQDDSEVALVLASDYEALRAERDALQERATFQKQRADFYLREIDASQQEVARLREAIRDAGFAIATGEMTEDGYQVAHDILFAAIQTGDAK